MPKEEEGDMGSIDFKLHYKSVGLVILLLFTTNCVLTTSSAWVADAPATPKTPLLKQEEEAIMALLSLTMGLQQLACNSVSDPQCDGKSIICDDNCNNTTFCHVIEIDFSMCNLNGRIPPEIGNLTHLTSLDLSRNRLRGPIPPSLVQLQSLSVLDLSDNSLSGNLPPFRMKSLQYMYLSKNKLDGPIPKSFVNLTSLVNLDLSSNCFESQIPPELGALKNLSRLYINNNVLNGSIAEDLGNNSNLMYLDVSDNQLSGSIPPQLGNLTNLLLLVLRANYLVGELPSSFMRLVNLTVFRAQGNSLSGEISTLMVNWTQLRTLDLLGNNFEGPLPTEISSMESLVSLKLSNVVTAGGSANSFPDLRHMTSLRELTLRNCSLRGPIPNYIWELRYLVYLDLSFNELSGFVPNSINTSLTYIFLRKNKLNGILPAWLVALANTRNVTSSHRYVDVSENNFTLTTSVSDALPNQDVNIFPGCSSNSSTTNLCDSFCGNRKYKQLFINCGGEQVDVDGKTYYADVSPNGASTFFFNKTGGWGYSSMGLAYERRQSFTAKDPCNLPKTAAVLLETARVATISLKYYGFCFIKGDYTVKLHFAEIGSSKNKGFPPIRPKRIFDVDIQGRNVRKSYDIAKTQPDENGDTIIPFNTSIESHLEIHLYWSGNGSIFFPPNYGPLISAISVEPVPKQQKTLSTALKAVIAVSSLVFLALLLLVLWKLGYLGGKRSSKEELKATELFPGVVYTFHQIKDATQNFNAVNKLGEGGFGPVYKGLLSDGTTIAVKQLSGKSKQGIREFVTEIGTISALQHPNLVKLMGCCAEDNELLLIYEYMENNSLDYALFRSEELKSRLNWSTRVKIILGIAKGLTYLHEESKLKIIHRDIKPTNILLDKELNSKITDFGYAKLNEEEHTHVITRIAGTTGYMAPEYAMRGYLTPKADVYSFGVVTLEIVSGRNSASYRPSDQTVYLLDLAYVLHEQGNLMDLVDPKLGTDYSWTEASAILELAMMCTNPSPTLRPTMSEIVKIIEGKAKIKTTSSTAHPSKDDNALNKAVAALSQPSQPESYSTAGPSEATPSYSNSNNITNEI
ncbi:putative LRR receptor-like serine/threonine-protein kinase isoform X4 [Capsicum chacoense]